MKNSKSKKSNTGYKNIYWKKNINKFVSRINGHSLKKGIEIHIGVYDTLKEAIKAREQFIKSLF